LASAAIANAATKATPVFHFFQYPGFSQTYAYNISSNNTIVGVYGDSSTTFHGFMLSNHKLTTIDAPNGIDTFAEGVNSSSTVVGFYLDLQGNAQAFSYANGVFTDIGPPGALQSYANGIDDLGHISGQFLDSDGVSKGWIFDGTTYKTVLRGLESVVFDINEQGEAVVVWRKLSGLYEAALYDGTKLFSINVPGALESFAHGISSAGDVALYWTRDEGTFHGAVWRGQKFTKLDAPGCDNTFLNGINDHHVIVGSCNKGAASKGFYAIY